MAHPRYRAYCAFCETDQVFRHSSFSHGMHRLISVLTLGVWGIGYGVLYWRWRQRAGWRCSECGHRFRMGGRVHGKLGVPPSRVQPLAAVDVT